MAVYSGILDIANNNNALAALMGHEIAHAVARHGSERASQGVLIDLGTMALEKLILGQPLSGDGRRLYEYFANFGLMFEICLFVLFKNGPPDAVKIIFSTFVLW